MHRLFLVILASLVSLSAGCSKPPPPPVTPKPAVVDAGGEPDAGEPAPRVEVAPLPEPIDIVAAFPERKDVEANTEEGLLYLLLNDPVAAEAALAALESPDNFRIQILAAFARTRGEKSYDVPAERLLPLLDGGVVGEVDAGTDAWIAVDDTALKAKGKTLRTLPLETQVRVVALSERTATVELAVAKLLIYGATGHQPEKRTDETVRGEVSRDALRGSPLDLEALITDARAQPDSEDGKLLAIALWQRAHRIEPSARTREGMLRAGFVAKRATTVVSASLARDFAPVKALALEWACGPGAPPAAQRLDTLPKVLGDKQCVRSFDARRACSTDSKAEKKKRADRKVFMDSVKTQGSWLHFTVDARAPRQVFLVSTPMVLADPCADFEEVSLEAGNGRVRRLFFPVGTNALELWVPVERGPGLEHAVVSAASEQHAVEWLRSREPYRWTVGAGDELQVSLNVNSTGFKVANDVAVAAKVLAPERGCSCEQDSPQ